MLTMILLALSALCFLFASLGVTARIGWSDLGRFFFVCAAAGWVWRG